MSGGRLVVLDRAGREVKRFPLAEGLATLGSDPACDIRIMLPTVSPHHATVVVHANQTVVRNVCEGETLVNGSRVSVAALRHGDVISIGGRHLRWDYADPNVRRAQAPQSALYVSRRKTRAARRGSGPAAAALRDPALQLALEMTHRASMPGSAGGKQVAIVQPQRRDTSDQIDKNPPRTPIQANKRPRTSKVDLDTSINEVDNEKTKRKSSPRVSPKLSNLQNTTKATLWIESRKTSPRKSTKVHTPTQEQVQRVRRNTVSAKKSTPLRLTVLKRAQSAQKMKVTKIEAPLKIDHTKQAALLLMTGHSAKSKLSSPNTSSSSSSGRSASSLVKRAVSRGRTDHNTEPNTTVTILEITDSDGRNSSVRTSAASRRSGQKSPRKSPSSPRKSALKDPTAKRGTRKTESIKFDLSNLENYSQDTDVLMVTDTTKQSFEDTSEDDVTLRYSESSAVQSPSPRRPIHSRTAKILEKTLGTTLTESPAARPLPPASPLPRRSSRGTVIVQKALTDTDTASYSRRSTKPVSDNNDSRNATVSSAYRTRTLSPRTRTRTRTRTPRNDLESYSIVDLVSIDTDDSARSTSVYDSAGSTDNTAFGTPQNSTGWKTRSTIDPTLLGSSTPYVKSTRSLTPRSRSRSNTSSKTSVNRSQSARSSTGSRRSKSLSTPENTEDIKKHISVNSTRISRASRSRSRINDSDLLLVDHDDDSPRTSKRVSAASKSTRSSVNTGASVNSSITTTPVHSPAHDGTSTPENRRSPEEASTPVLSIQSLLDSSQTSLAFQKSTRRGRPSFIVKRKTMGVVTEPKIRVGTKSKSMNFSARKTRLRLSSDSAEADDRTHDSEIVTPKSAVKLVQEGVKNKHSTAKKPQSKRSIIDDLNNSDIVKQLFNSPVKRKLSQSMTEFSRRQLFDDDEIVQAKRPTRNTIALTGRTPDNSLLEHSDAYTPELFVSPISTPTNSPDLACIKRLFDKNTPENDLRNVRGVKALLRTPRTRSSIKNDLRNVSGVKTVFAKGPKNSLSDVRVKEVFASSPKNDLRRVSGVKSLFQSARKRKSPRNELDDVRGLKKLFKAKSPVNDLRNVSGVKRILRRTSPKNDLTDVRGVRRMFRQEKQRNDFNDVSGVEELFDLSNQSRKDADSLFDQLVGKPQVRAVYSKTFSTKTVHKTKGLKSKSLHASLDVIANNVHGWLEHELNKAHGEASTSKSPNKSKANMTRELQNLVTDTVEGTAPLCTSRVRSSTVIRSNQSDRKKSASELYSGHTLPIKKRSLVGAAIEKGKEEALPIKKRAVVHSTPLKGRLDQTLSAAALGRVSPIAAVHDTSDLHYDSSIRPNQHPRKTIEARPKSRRGTRAKNENLDTLKAPEPVQLPKKPRGQVKVASPEAKPASPNKEKANASAKLQQLNLVKVPYPVKSKKASPAKAKKASSVKRRPASPAKQSSPAKLASLVLPKTTRSKRKDVSTPESNTKRRAATLLVTKKSPVMSPKPRATRKRKEPETLPSPKPSPKKTRATRKHDEIKDDKPKTPKNTRAKIQKATVVVSKPSPLLKPRATRTRGQTDSEPENIRKPRKTVIVEEKPESSKKSQVQTKSTNKANVAEAQSAPKTRGRKTVVNDSKNSGVDEQPETRTRKGRKTEEVAVKKTRNIKQDKTIEAPARKNTRKTVNTQDKSVKEPAPKKTKKTDNEAKSVEEPKPSRTRGKKVDSQESVQSEPTTRARRAVKPATPDVKTRKRKNTAPGNDVPPKVSKSKDVSEKARKTAKASTAVGKKSAVKQSDVDKGQGDAPVQGSAARPRPGPLDPDNSPNQRNANTKTVRGKKTNAENVPANQQTGRRKRVAAESLLQAASTNAKLVGGKKSGVVTSPDTLTTRANTHTEPSKTAGRSRRR